MELYKLKIGSLCVQQSFLVYVEFKDFNFENVFLILFCDCKFY